MSQQIIDPKKAPILWDTVNDAFSKINNNFAELYLSLGSGGVVDLSSLSSNISPSASDIHDLGSATNRWRHLYLSGSSLFLGTAVITSTGNVVNLPEGSTIGTTFIKDPIAGAFKTIAVTGQNSVVADNELATLTINGSGISVSTDPAADSITIVNDGVLSVTGVNIGVSGTGIGNVVLTNTGVTKINVTTGNGISVTNGGVGDVVVSNTGVVDLAAGNGIQVLNLGNGSFNVRNTQPNVDQNIFNRILVAGQANVEADSPFGILTVIAGNGIAVTTNAGSRTLTLASTGVTALAAAGDGIIVSSNSGSFTVANSGVTQLTAGSGISLTGSSGSVTVTNSRVGFTSIAVGGQFPILADNATDTLVLVAGEGVELLTNPINDSIEFNVSYLQGNVFGNDSTLLVDAGNGEIVGNINTARLRTSETSIALGQDAGLSSQSSSAVAIGWGAGLTNQGAAAIGIGAGAGGLDQGIDAVAIGAGAGGLDQGIKAVAIGAGAGSVNQGAYSIAIGANAGAYDQPANSIVINAGDSPVSNAAAAGFYVLPIREVTGPQTVYYDPVTYEVTWGPVPAGGGGGGGIVSFELDVAADDSTQRRINSGETLQFVGASGITTTSNAEGKITIALSASIPNLGSVTFAGTTIDSDDSSGIVFTPAVTFESDIAVENELIVNNRAVVHTLSVNNSAVIPTLSVNNLNVSGLIASQGSGTPEMFSDNEILLTAGTRVEISSSPLKMASFTTAGRDLLIAVNGDVIYNTTLNKFQGYVNGSWINFH